MRRYLFAGVSAFALIVGVGRAHAAAFFMNGAMFQTYVVPASGEYEITAYGAQGGANSLASKGSGGLGAEVQGTISLVSGTTLTIGVGERGTDGLHYYGGGGGGLSFVESGSYGAPGTTLLAVAGGGGGGGYAGPGGSGQTMTSGGAMPGSGAGGANGSGGGAFYGRPPNGSGGAGFTGRFNDGYSGGTYGGGGSRYGGNAGSPYGGYGPFGGYGGYMGGGGAGFEPGGGGGGYSGGGGGGSDYGGGGGGSFLAASFTDTTRTGGVRSGDGYVTINPATEVPEPGSFALLGTGLLGLGVIGWRRRRT